MTTQTDYVQRMFERVGNRDPVALLAELPRKIERSLAGLDQKTRHTAEAPGRWSVHHVIQHLADAELINRYRLRLIVAQDEPVITGWDENRFASSLGYDETPLEEALNLLLDLREANVRFLRHLRPEQWDRAGMHAERGKESLKTLTVLMAGHDLAHLDQMVRIRNAVGAR